MIAFLKKNSAWQALKSFSDRFLTAPPSAGRLKKFKEQLILAGKVINYRRDVLSVDAIASIESQSKTLLDAMAVLKGCIKGLPADSQTPSQQAIDDARRALVEAEQKAAAASQSLHVILKNHGGDIYPLTFANDWTDVLLVSAIVTIAIRTFFFQPFKIPTNSMWPTYSGMRPVVYSIAEGKERPVLPVRLFNLLTTFSFNHQFHAPVSGEIYFIVREIEAFGTRYYEVPYAPATPASSGLKLFASPKREYVIGIARNESKTLEKVLVHVPFEFPLDEVLVRSFFKGHSRFETLMPELIRNQKALVVSDRSDAMGNRIKIWQVETDLTVEKNGRVLDFDIQTGDMLFVNRFAYHFVSPKVGDPIVFRTDDIPGRRVNGVREESYFIKRLVGMPGDTLKIVEPVLKRKPAAGDTFEPIAGNRAFSMNAQREGEYEGYVASGFLGKNRTDTVADGYFYAMGDNSDQSADSRFWGYGTETRTTDEIIAEVPQNQVPAKSIVGHASFIFYPFTSRWGNAH